MPVTAIVGANWGDEGKGKITDLLAQNADYVVRFQGGANAGHTIINQYGRFSLHLLPSGIFSARTTNIIGSGVAFDVRKFVTEIKSVIEPYHILQDTYEEERLAGKAYGSTKSGIAPFYQDKYAKTGIQVNELFDDSILKDKVANICTLKNVLFTHLYHKDPLDPEEVLATLHEYRDLIAPYLADTSAILTNALKEGKRVLVEGQLGTLKDPDMGIYPMVTSSYTTAAFAAVGAGFPPYEIKDIVTVVKAYSSAVGGGEFVSEIFGDEAEELRRRGGDKGEYGATTGRPRRIGWFDCVASRYGVRVQGATEVALTILDALGYLKEIPVCVGYQYGDEVLRDFPTTPVLKKCKPIYKTLPGWNCDIRGIRKYEDLPENARAYVEFIEKEIGVRISMVSNGPGREDIIYR